jgi:hypothetical protein
MRGIIISMLPFFLLQFQPSLRRVSNAGSCTYQAILGGRFNYSIFWLSWIGARRFVEKVCRKDGKNQNDGFIAVVILTKGGLGNQFIRTLYALAFAIVMKLRFSMPCVLSYGLGRITLRLRTEFNSFQSIILIPFPSSWSLGDARLVSERKLVSWFFIFLPRCFDSGIKHDSWIRTMVNHGVNFIGIQCWNSHKSKWSETDLIPMLTLFVH